MKYCYLIFGIIICFSISGCKDLNTDRFYRKITVYVPAYECHNPAHSHYRDENVIIRTNGTLIPLQQYK